MKSFKIVALIAIVMLLASAVLAMSHTPEDRGKALFNDTKLGGGTSGKSCGTCHPDGKGLEGIGSKKEWKTPGGETQVPRRGGQHLYYHGAQGQGPGCEVRADEGPGVLSQVPQTKRETPRKRPQLAADLSYPWERGVSLSPFFHCRPHCVP